MWSREHTFLAVCAPGLENVCRSELTTAGIPQTRIIPGGVEFQGRIEAGYTANLWLRTAGRVLMRVAHFRSGAYEELFAHCRKTPWETLMHPGTPLSFRSVHWGSRVTHSTKIEDTVREAVLRRFQDLGLAYEPPSQESGGGTPDARSVEPQLVYVRVEENRCTLSMDMSGDLLHRRGYRSHVYRAPLRETYAAALILLSGWNGDEPFLDPMCGSGVFPLEAALMARDQAPGLERDFAFTRWPSFRRRAWEHVLRQARDRIRPEPLVPIYGRDYDPQAIEAARSNARRAGLEEVCDLDAWDFFSSPPPFDRGTLALNPPYGKRLSSGMDTVDVYGRIGRKLRKDYRGWRAVVIAPDTRCARALGWNTRRAVRLDHGGIRVHALMGRIP